MDESLDEWVRRLAAGSEVLAAATAVRRDGGLELALGDTPLRPLFKPEVAQLEALGSTAEDWSRVRVAGGFNPRRVRNCEFLGDVVLGEFKRRVPLADGVEVVAGLWGSTLADCVIGHNAVVKDVRLLANYVVGPGAVVVDCGRVTCSAGATFGNGTPVAAALEGGGRVVESFAELDVELAAAVAAPGPRRAELDGYRRAVAEYRDRATADRGVIGAAARVWGVPRLEDTHVGPAARVDAATAVVRSTLLSGPDEPAVVETGAIVTDSVVQWGARVAGAAVVERSVVGEGAEADRHATVRDSVLGPNARVAAGEVISCVLGPFVGCPHQSLLISTLWPAGRGNVGYGAMAGANHTGRAPDQEFRAGEGLFLGLGASVQFPCDLSGAPYSMVACGTALAPQRVTFPFALIAPPREHLPDAPPGHNQIAPGWVLRENAYAVRRAEEKYRARNRARRARFDLAVLRRDTVELMRDAARRLSAAGGRATYTERDVPGLGQNVMTERDRVRGAAAYRFHVCYYALLGLGDRVRDAVAAGANPARVMAHPDGPDAWGERRGWLLGDFGIEDAGTGLRLLAAMALRVAEDCERSRARDDDRGARVIDDYAEVHPPADRDPVVRAARAEADRLRDEADRYLRQFPAVARRAGDRGADPFAAFGLTEGPTG